MTIVTLFVESIIILLMQECRQPVSETKSNHTNPVKPEIVNFDPLSCQQVHWAAAQIDNQFHLAHPQAIDKLLTLKLDIQAERNIMKIQLHQQLKSECEIRIGKKVSSWEASVERAQPSLHLHNCRTQLNESLQQQKKGRLDMQLQEQEEMRKVQTQLKRAKKSKRPSDHPHCSKEVISKENFGQSSPELESKAFYIDDEHQNRQVKGSCKKGESISDGEATSELPLGSSHSLQQGAYSKFQAAAGQEGHKGEIDRESRRQSSNYNSREGQNQHKSVGIDQPVNVSNDASKLQLEELDRKISQMQLKLCVIEKRQNQLQALEQPKQISQISQQKPTHFTQIRDTTHQAIVHSERSACRHINPESQEPLKIANEVNSGIKYRDRKLEFSSSIINYHHRKQQSDDNNQIISQVELKKIIPEPQQQRNEQEASIRELKTANNRDQVQEELVLKQASDNSPGQSQSHRVSVKQTGEKYQRPDKSTREQALYKSETNLMKNNESDSSIRIKQKQRCKKINPQVHEKGTSQSKSDIEKKYADNGFRDYCPPSLRRKGFVIRQVNDLKSSRKGRTISSVSNKGMNQLPYRNSSESISPALTGRKIYELQVLKSDSNVDRNRLKNNLPSIPNITIHGFSMCQLPEPPQPTTLQKDLIVLAKTVCQEFHIPYASQSSLNLRKYRNCVIIKTGDVTKSIVWHFTGKFYFGGWEQDSEGQGKKNGFGFEYIPDKHRYRGQFLDGKKSGCGTMVTVDGNVYEGQWENGQKHGHGKYFDKKRNSYFEGSWKMGRKDGKGILKLSEIEYYYGTFENSLKHGYGVQHFANGDLYQGQFQNGKFHGRGKYYWANGSFYDGEFYEGHRSGTGTWKSAEQNGDTYSGQYKLDRKQGFGQYTWSNGSRYEGYFENDLKHGQGRVQYPDGRQVVGEWQYGKIVQAISDTARKSDSGGIPVKPDIDEIVETPSKQLRNSNRLHLS